MGKRTGFDAIKSFVKLALLNGLRPHDVPVFGSTKSEFVVALCKVGGGLSDIS